MIVALLLSANVLQDTAPPQMIPLESGTTCYAILRNDEVVGSTLQSIQETTVDGQPAWEITVHQRMPTASFDLRDRFVVSKIDLQPHLFSSERGVDRTRPGWQRISVQYGRDRISGALENAEGLKIIDEQMSRPIWDGNLWGLTFAGLPFRPDAEFQLPYWQYDKGFGTFRVRVSGRNAVPTATGPVDSWVVEAADAPDRTTEYFLRVETPGELGYRAGPFEQRLGGECPGEAG